MLTIKEQFRKELLKKLRIQGKGERIRKSRIIKEKLYSLPEFKNAQCVMFYASKQHEVDTSEMVREALRMGKRVALPRCTSLKTIVPKEIDDWKRDLEKSSYGIYEPREYQKNARADEIDLVIVPGVGFDQKNVRLGRGRGYYDKFLKSLPRNTISIGLAFDFQLIENLPQDSHDIPVSKIITN